MATEVLGIIFGKYKGSTRDLNAGGLSCENSYMPHGGASSRLFLAPKDTENRARDIRDLASCYNQKLGDGNGRHRYPWSV